MHVLVHVYAYVRTYMYVCRPYVWKRMEISIKIPKRPSAFHVGFVNHQVLKSIENKLSDESYKSKCNRIENKNPTNADLISRA